jgi:hypothetical protein
VFFKFWLIDIHLFDNVVICPLSELKRNNLPFDLEALGVYVNGQIYLKNMSDVRTFFHEASHHVVALYAPHLRSDLHGHAVNETLADIVAAAAVELDDVPRGVGWSLIELAYQGPCREAYFHKFFGPILPDECILSQIKYRPELMLRLFSEPTFF